MKMGDMGVCHARCKKCTSNTGITILFSGAMLKFGCQGLFFSSSNAAEYQFHV